MSTPGVAGDCRCSHDPMARNDEARFRPLAAPTARAAWLPSWRPALWSVVSPWECLARPLVC
jgi:hypothetical protein